MSREREFAAARDELYSQAPELAYMLDQALDDAHRHGRTQPAIDMPPSDAHYLLVMRLLSYVDVARAGAKAVTQLHTIRKAVDVSRE